MYQDLWCCFYTCGPTCGCNKAQSVLSHQLQLVVAQSIYGRSALLVEQSGLDSPPFLRRNHYRIQLFIYLSVRQNNARSIYCGTRLAGKGTPKSEIIYYRFLRTVKNYWLRRMMVDHRDSILCLVLVSNAWLGVPLVPINSPWAVGISKFQLSRRHLTVNEKASTKLEFWVCTYPWRINGDQWYWYWSPCSTEKMVSGGLKLLCFTADPAYCLFFVAQWSVCQTHMWCCWWATLYYDWVQGTLWSNIAVFFFLFFLFLLFFSWHCHVLVHVVYCPLKFDQHGWHQQHHMIMKAIWLCLLISMR